MKTLISSAKLFTFNSVTWLSLPFLLVLNSELQIILIYILTARDALDKNRSHSQLGGWLI